MPVFAGILPETGVQPAGLGPIYSAQNETGEFVETNEVLACNTRNI
jgi:hypothetical protein